MDWSPHLSFQFHNAPVMQSLKQHFEEMQFVSMADMFIEDENRYERFSLSAANLSLDYSKNRINSETVNLLCKLADNRQLKSAIGSMFKGDLLNVSEQRPALHTALRNFSGREVLVDGHDVMEEVQATLQRMRDFCWRIRNQHWRGFSNQPFTDVVSIGIGGSFLGPKLASDALKPYWTSKIRCHYLANIDGSDLAETLRELNPATTLFIIQSKSFSTQETLMNANACRDWFVNNGGCEESIARHFCAVTASVDKAKNFGIEPDNVFPMWDWVGGRYSLWSAIGLPVMLAVGYENFRELLMGAHEMDEHFRTAPFEKNMPVLMGLLGVWYVNFFGAQSHAVLPYDHYLSELPAHIQQLDMESNGKSVDAYGRKLEYQAGPIIWGGVGSNGQHAYHQLLHQGKQFVPCDFILPLITHNVVGNFHSLLASNCISQAQALMVGKSEQQVRSRLEEVGLSQEQVDLLAPQQTIPGNRPSNMITFQKLSPREVGSLIALYEHKVFVQGHVWGVNSFDQWGVELGKQLTKDVHKVLLSDDQVDLSGFDASTSGLIKAFKSARYKL